MRDWQRDAPLFIADAVKDLPADATIKQRRAALRKVAFDYHGGTGWGRKQWSRHVRAYLEKHGLPPIRPEESKRADVSAALVRMNAPDITFPWRAS